MVRTIFGITGAALLGAVCWGSPAVAAQPDCNAALSSYEINDCFTRAYRVADRALNTAYRKRMAEEDAHGKALLTQAQRAWIVFRDKACTYETAGSEGGTIHPTEYTACLIDKTEARTKELR